MFFGVSFLAKKVGLSVCSLANNKDVC